jgi:hemoglobin
MQEKSIYEKYGGDAFVTTLVEKFYEEVLTKEILKPFFVNTNFEKHFKTVIPFFIMASGGPNNYAGKSMRDAHKGMGLTDEHFDAVQDSLGHAMDVLGVSEGEIKGIFSGWGNLES